ncbi:uncharacterized protein [Littorina saxatilis]|uniref:uncharacterized protein isoform X2 n=1 Tax=Littorina saxatilis TaxID=31220 RepID=UPI0038B565B3
MSSEPVATISECLTTTQDWEVKTTVCITGGCGFLAQHLIKQLNLYTTNIECVRVLDFCQFEQALGTRNVIKACQENSVRNLIYVSNTSVVKSYNSIISGTEENTSYPKKHLFPDGESRAEAESLVLGANGLVLKDLTSTLRTLCIRPVTLYGELDSYLLPHLVDLAIFNEGHIPCIGSLRSKHHFMYVGNAAWALLCANKAINKGSFQLPTLIPRISQSMTEDVWTSGGQTPSTSSGGKRLSKTLVKPKGKLWGKKLFSSIGRDSRSNSVSLPTVPRTSDPSVSGYSVDVITPPWETYDVKGEGKVYFICDDTPPINFFLFIKPILYRYGYFLTSWSLPEKWAKRIATVVYVVALILYPFIMCNPRVTINDVHHVCRTYTFSDKLARQRLGYMPIFNPKEGMRRTTEFYDNKYKEAMMSHLVDHALSSKHVGMLRRMSMIKRDIAVMDMTDTGRRFRVKRVDSRNKGWW